MISQQAIVKYGLDAASLKAHFAPDNGIISPIATRIISRWRARAQQGRDFNLSQHRLYHAIDRAWEAGFHQTTQTMVQIIRDLSVSSGEEAALDSARKWGLTHLITKMTDPKTGVPTGKELLNLPVMYGVILNLPRSFTLMRVARIVNERLQVPLMKYEPAYSTDQDKLWCEVGTQRIEQGNREFGYAATFAEAVQYAHMYGQQLQLIAEEWFTQLDIGDGGPQVGKEGLRYVHPHPSRSYWDIDWPLVSFNTDTGCRYVGYWRVTTYGSVRGEPYWNIDRISHRGGPLSDPRWMQYFQTTGSCRMSMGYSNEWFSPLDRQRRIDRGTAFLTAAEDDQPVWITEHFEKMNPKREFEDPNMPDTDLWFRIVLASDDTPLYCTALVDRPGVVWPYEPTGASAVQSSLMLELLPYGDHASNLMTQALLSAEQNLANLTLFDQDVIDPELVRKDLENPNKRFYRKLNFVGFSGRKLFRQQSSMDGLFKSYRFPGMDINDHLALLSQLVTLMQRVVGMSDQEIGSAASHEQSAEEIRTIHVATSQRAEYVAAWIDFTFESWKRQLWTYYRQYARTEALAYLQPGSQTLVERFALRVVKTDSNGGMLVAVRLSDMRVEHFIAQRDGPNRIPWTTIGGQMISFLQAFMGSPVAQSIPPVDVIHLINEALEALQFPRTFRIPMPKDAQGQISEATQQFVMGHLQELAKQIKAFVGQEVAQVEQEVKAVEHELTKKISELPPANEGTVIHAYPGANVSGSGG